MLGAIFTWQAAVFTYGVIGCYQKGGKDACPDLGDRYENTVNVMVATTLALLGAGAVAGVTQRNSSASDRALPSSQEQAPLNPRTQVQERVQGKVRESGMRRSSDKES